MDNTSNGGNGQPQPTSELFQLVYDQLRQLAKHHMAQEHPGHTLQATALVHEAYVRLAQGDESFANPAPFYAAAAEAMRRILVDHARARATMKPRGVRGFVRMGLSTVLDLAAAPEP